jgi:glycosyltransferase involved in cell wall biosynthesis
VRVHVAEVGLAWPPETFLMRKLDGVTRRGVRVTVVTGHGGAAAPAPPGVDLVRLPNTDDGVLTLGPLAAADLLRLALRDRGRLRRVLRALARLPRPTSLRRRLGWARVFAHLEPLRPDVVHFEWESAAVRYLPLVDLWGCPMVMSCRGGLDLYSQSGTHRRALDGLARAFDRAAAVHCVSDAMRAEATRHGLDPRKAQVIRSGVQLELFTPPRA